MLNIISFLLIAVGIIIICKINLKDISDKIFVKIMNNDYKNKSIKSKIDISRGKKKENIIKKQILETENILKISKKEKQIPFIFAIALLLSIAGIIFSASLGNMYLGIVLGIGLLFIPFWIAEINMQNIKCEISENLETALSGITSTYNRNENIVIAIEENIENIDEPIASFFKDFLVDIRGEKSTEEALEELKSKFNNVIFHEWINNIIYCQNDRTLKATLMPTVERMSDIRIVNSRSEAGYSAVRQEFMLMVIMVIGTIPLMKALEEKFYTSFMTSIVGKIILAGVVAVIFISIYKVLKITKPLDYK